MNKKKTQIFLKLTKSRKKHYKYYDFIYFITTVQSGGGGFGSGSGVSGCFGGGLSGRGRFIGGYNHGCANRFLFGDLCLQFSAPRLILKAVGCQSGVKLFHKRYLRDRDQLFSFQRLSPARPRPFDSPAASPPPVENGKDFLITPVSKLATIWFISDLSSSICRLSDRIFRQTSLNDDAGGII